MASTLYSQNLGVWAPRPLLPQIHESGLPFSSSLISRTPSPQHPRLSRPSDPGLQLPPISGFRVGPPMSYLGLQDLRVPFGEETLNPIPGFASPAPPSPWSQGVFQDLCQAVCGSPRPGHQEAGELSLGGILYPLQDKGDSQMREGRDHPTQSPDPQPSPPLRLRSQESGPPATSPLRPSTFNIFSSPSIKRRRTGMSIPVPEEKRARGLVTSYQPLPGMAKNHISHESLGQA